MKLFALLAAATVALCSNALATETSVAGLIIQEDWLNESRQLQQPNAFCNIWEKFYGPLGTWEIPKEEVDNVILSVSSMCEEKRMQ